MTPFGEWTPDSPNFGNSGCTVAQNVIARALAYGPFPSFGVVSAAISAQSQGAAIGADSQGVVYNFAGTATKLLKNAPGDSTSYVDVSKAGGYNLGSDQTWRFLQFGTQMVAVNIADPMQAYTIGGGGLFANLSATAPYARDIANIRDFAMAINLYDGSGNYYPNRAQWCGINDVTNWPTPGSASAIAAQSDRQDVQDGGALQRIIGGEVGYLFGQRSIWRVPYVGPPDFFNFIRVEQKRGTPFPGSVAGFGGIAFYCADDGFYLFDGNISTPIGAEKVDRFFFSDLDRNYAPRIRSCVDPTNKGYLIVYPGSGHSMGNPNRGLYFNYSVGRWTALQFNSPNDLEDLATLALTLGYTLEGLDAISSSLDALPFSLDSAAWAGGTPIVGAFNTSHKFGYFNGTAMAARLTGGTSQLTPGMRSLVRSVTALVEGAPTTTTITPLTQARLIDAQTAGAASAMNAFGECPMLSDARFHAFQMDLAGPFTNAIGYDPTFAASGVY